MSHLKQRTENDCLNCGAVVEGRFCSQCGQENVETHLSAWQLVVHFFNDFTHFDGKFFTTISKLIRKPGFLSAEFKKGRRKRYLDPVRMYIFTSFVFFLIFYSFATYNPEVAEFRFNGKTSEEVKNMDSLEFDRFTKSINQNQPMTRAEYKHLEDSVNLNNSMDMFLDYDSKAEYDSLLAIGAVKHGWLDRKMTYRQFELKEKYKNDRNAVFKDFWDRFIHSFPQLFFLSLPLYALCLKLMYRRQKEFTYVFHSIFSIHIYIVTFLVGFLAILVSYMSGFVSNGVVNIANGILLIGLCVYEVLAMKYFYKQSGLKTFLKYCILNCMRFAILVFLLIIFIIVIFLKS